MLSDGDGRRPRATKPAGAAEDDSCLVRAAGVRGGV